MRPNYVLATALTAALLPAAHAEFVYNNGASSSYLGQRYSPGTNEIGDEVTLGGTGRYITDFDFQYYGISFSGNEQARIRFYYNDGAAYNGDPNAKRPLTMFYDSGYFDIGPTPGQIIQLGVGSAWMPSTFLLPERFTWTVQFSGIESGEQAGVDLYDPVVVGGNFTDFWKNTDGTASGWQLQTNAAGPMNFGARIQAVPEPSFWSLCAAGGLAGFFLIRRRAKK